MDAPQDEEAQLAATLAALEAKASRHITDLFSSTLDNRSAFNAQLTQIRDDLAALRAATRDLAILTEEQDTEEQAARLAEMLKGHQAEYECLQTAFKQANVQARRNTEAAAAAARKALLAGGDAAAAPGRAGQASVVVTSQGITKSLLRTRQLMAQELEHTSATLAAMDASNDRLAEGREELRSHRGLFSGSRRLLRALFTSSVLDTVSLYGGLAVFFLVVAYILQKRTLYFAPVGKYMAPVTGTAWNVSRAAAARAGQLPGAALALQRRLRQRGGGAANGSLPEALQPLRMQEPVDAAGQATEQQQWELHRDEQKPHDSGNNGGAADGDGQESEPQQPDTPQQWAEAEPDPLADIEEVPEDGESTAGALVLKEELLDVSARPEAQPDSPPDAPDATSEPPASEADDVDSKPAADASAAGSADGDTAAAQSDEAAGEEAGEPAAPPAGSKDAAPGAEATAPADERPHSGITAKAGSTDAPLSNQTAADSEAVGTGGDAAAADEPSAAKGSGEQDAAETTAADDGNSTFAAVPAKRAADVAAAAAEALESLKNASKAMVPDPLLSSASKRAGKTPTKPAEPAAAAEPQPGDADSSAETAEDGVAADAGPDEPAEAPAEAGQPPTAAAPQPDEADRPAKEAAAAEAETEPAVEAEAEPAAKSAAARKPVGRIELLAADKEQPAGGTAAARQPAAEDAEQAEEAAAAEDEQQAAGSAAATAPSNEPTEEAQEPAAEQEGGAAEPSAEDAAPEVPPPEKHGLVVLPPPAAEPAAAADAPGGAPAAPKDAPDSADDGLAFILGKPQPESASLNLVEAAELASVAAEPGGGDAAPPLSGAPEPDPAASAAGDPLAAAEPPQPDAAAAPGGERSVTAEEGLEPPLRGADNGMPAEEGLPVEDGNAAEVPGGDVDSGKVWDKHGNEFHWKWNPDKGARGTWQLFAAGTDTIVLEHGPDGAEVAETAAEQAVPPVAEDPSEQEAAHDEL